MTTVRTYVTRQHFSSGNPVCEPQRLPAPFFAEPIHLRAHFQGGQSRSLRVVRKGDRSAENKEECVTQVIVERTVVFEDNFVQSRKAIVQDRHVLLRPEPTKQSCRSPEVAKQDSRILLVCAESCEGLLLMICSTT